MAAGGGMRADAKGVCAEPHALLYPVAAGRIGSRHEDLHLAT